jgi:hypothetical protein
MRDGLSRPERLRQVHHDAHDHGPGFPRRRQARITGRAYRELRWPLREVGALLEAKAFHPGRPARAHLAALAASNHIPAARVDKVLELTGIAAVGRRRPGKFSLGMAQRLASPPRCSATPRCCCSTSRSTDWTRRASGGSAACCGR